MRNSIGNIDVFEVHLVGQTDTKQKYIFSIGEMCKNSEKGDLALRFKARFGGFERSGITLAVVWRTQVRGTRRRRVLKRGLHIFATLFQCFLLRKVASRSYNNKKHDSLRDGFSGKYV